MTNLESQSPVFLEMQRFRQWWIWFIVWCGVAIATVIFVVQVIFGHPVGNNPAPDSMVWIIFFLIGVGFPLFMYSVKLTTELHSDQLILRYTPLWTRTIPLEDITRCSPCVYHPLRQYGGWGIRYGLGVGRGWCYTVYGNQGVELELNSGQPVLVGSQCPDELAAAINRAKSAR